MTEAAAKKIHVEQDEGTALRPLSGAWGKVYDIVALLAGAFHLYTGAFGIMSSHIQVPVHWLFLSAMVLLRFHHKKGEPTNKVPWWDLVLVIGTVVANVYLMMTAQDRLLGIASPSTLELGLGIFMILLVVEATRRTTGPVLAWTCIALLGYAMVGHLLPDFLSHKGYDIERLVAFMYLSPQGIYGTALGISSSYVVLFILFGGFLNATGGGQFFTDASYALAGRFRGGPAKTAVVSSAAMGMLSGSPVANVVTTGTFTIPLMIKTGVRPVMAAAIEAVAATGGSVMPPIMGAAAFIMAEYLGVSYGEVVVAATIPAILYYLSVFLMVDLDSGREGLKGLPKEQLPKLGAVMRASGHLLLPLVVLVALLVYGYSPLKTVFYATALLLAVAALRPATRARLRFDILSKAVIGGIGSAMPVAAACAAAGIIEGVVALTGIGANFSAIMNNLAGDSALIALILTMVSAMILGFGMPVSATYIILASLTAPTLINLGIEPMGAHLFIFYFSSFAAITPPVALAAYAGAGIAGANPDAVGWLSCRIAVVAYIVPFMFAFAPSLLLQGPLHVVAVDFIAACIGVYLLSAGVQGYTVMVMKPLERALLFGAGLCLIKPGMLTNLLGLGCVAIVALMAYPRWRQMKATGPLPQETGTA